jgi:hypothetical protein
LDNFWSKVAGHKHCVELDEPQMNMLRRESGHPVVIFNFPIYAPPVCGAPLLDYHTAEIHHMLYVLLPQT